MSRLSANLEAVADGYVSPGFEVYERASIDSEPLTEYCQLFAMESIRVWQGQSSARMKVCHEHIKIRQHEWRLILEQVLEVRVYGRH